MYGLCRAEVKLAGAVNSNGVGQKIGEMTMMSRLQQCSLPDGRDPESQPVPQCPPAPMGYRQLLTVPDKDLTLTPDKVGAESGILKRGRGGKQSRQVRFDVSPKSKSIALNRSRVSGEEPGVVTVINQQSYSPSELQPHLRTTVARAGKGGRNREKPKESDPKSRTLPSDGLAEVLTLDQSGLPCEGAELNTTLALKAELHGLAEARFDSRKAVQDQLRKSTHTKNSIAIKATEGVNIPRAQNLYQGLVSVSVSEDQLISRALQDRLTLAPANRRSSKIQESPEEGPDLLAFYSPGELLRESPLIPEIQLPRPRTVPRPARATFDLYRKHRQWEA
ncbi:hypothetical protein GJAV_G00196970 [Gymnothorax javanicus]|nr:hypothetical protein GJAV_G00196970 [Gymnothorax javanicus]